MGGFAPLQVSIGLGVALVVFFAGLFYWGNRFKRYRRTTIMAIGVVGGLLMVGAAFALNHAETGGAIARIGLGVVAAGGLFVLAGATPAALGMLADISEEHPDDRGAIMGLYSVFLAVGQVVGIAVRRRRRGMARRRRPPARLCGPAADRAGAAALAARLGAPRRPAAGRRAPGGGLKARGAHR